VNLRPRALSYIDPDAVARAAGARFEDDLVIGAGATIGAGASLRRAVIWEGERVPAGLVDHDGVFAGGAFHRGPRADQASDPGGGSRGGSSGKRGNGAG
jgi:hypothetical protein